MSLGDGLNVLVSSPLNADQMNENWEAGVFGIALFIISFVIEVIGLLHVLVVVETWKYKPCHILYLYDGR